MYDLFHAAVRALHNPFVVQVGACDGRTCDPVFPLIVERNLAGLLIEPLLDLLRECEANYCEAGVDMLWYVGCAVAALDGSILLRRIDREHQDKLPAWTKGLGSAKDCNMLNPKIREEHDVPDDVAALIEAHTVCQLVEAEPLQAILKARNIGRVDVLVIDTEGMEYEVLQTFDLDRYRPPVMLIEHTTMTSADRDLLQRHVSKAGYAWQDLGVDWLFTHQD